MKIIKKNIKLIIGIIIGIIISGITVYAVTVSSSDVTYNNTNVQAAINDLYNRVKENSCRLITIYSAAADTIYYYDNGKKVELCSTGLTGKGICPSPSTNDVTLYSSIAKNPNDSSSPYSKSVNITSSTSSIKLMPDGEVLYWYGYLGNDDFVQYKYLSPGSTYVSDGSGSCTLTANTNNYQMQIYREAYTVGKMKNVTNYTKVVCGILSSSTTSGEAIQNNSTYLITSKQTTGANVNAYTTILPTHTNSIGRGKYEINISSVTGDAVVGISTTTYPNSSIKTMLEYLYLE